MACLSGKTRVAGIARCAAIASACVVVVKAQGSGCQGAATVPAVDGLAGVHAGYQVGPDAFVFGVVPTFAWCATSRLVRLLVLGAATSVRIGCDEGGTAWLTASTLAHGPGMYLPYCGQ